MVETLGQDMLDGGARGHHYFNKTYDLQNPVYEVMGFNLMGRETTETTATAVCIHYPEGYEREFAIKNRIDDCRATRDELKEVLDRAEELKRRKAQTSAPKTQRPMWQQTGVNKPAIPYGEKY